MANAPENLLFQRFELGRCFAEGGEVHVLRGRDRQTGRDVAVRRNKLHRTHHRYSGMVERSRRVAELKFEHPNLLDAVAFGEERDHYYMVYPFVDGPNLEQHVHKSGVMELINALTIIGQVLDAAEVLHYRGITHRDIKPNNIVLDRAHGTRAVLIDLTAARFPNDPPNSEGSNKLTGTPTWMAPEQLADPLAANHLTDMYAIAATLMFILTGQPPLGNKHTNESVLAAIPKEPPVCPQSLNPAIPRQVNEAILAGLSKDPHRRPESFEAFRQRLGLPQRSEASGAVNAAAAQAPQQQCPNCSAKIVTGGCSCHRCGIALNGRTGITRLHCLGCRAALANNDSPYCGQCGRKFLKTQMEWWVGAYGAVRYRVPHDQFVVGRAILSPGDDRISRKQLLVRADQRGLYVLADQGVNPAYIDGRPVRGPVELHDGSTVEVVETQCRIVM